MQQTLANYFVPAAVLMQLQVNLSPMVLHAKVFKCCLKYENGINYFCSSHCTQLYLTKFFNTNIIPDWGEPKRAPH